MIVHAFIKIGKMGFLCGGCEVRIIVSAVFNSITIPFTLLQFTSDFSNYNSAACACVYLGRGSPNNIAKNGSPASQSAIKTLVFVADHFRFPILR